MRILLDLISNKCGVTYHTKIDGRPTVTYGKMRKDGNQPSVNHIITSINWILLKRYCFQCYDFVITVTIFSFLYTVSFSNAQGMSFCWSSLLTDVCN
jgi:hypothetical protein